MASRPPAGEPEELVQRDRAVVWHPYAPMPIGLDPIPVVGAEGVRSGRRWTG